MNGNSGGGSINDLIKAQVMMKNDDPMAGIINVIYISIFEILIGYFNVVVKYISNLVDQFIKNKVGKFMEKQLPVSSLIKEKEPHEIMFVRNYKDANQNDMYERTDAVLYKIASLPQAKKIFYTDATHLINNKDPFEIENNIMFQLIELTLTNESTIDSIMFKLYSEKLNVCALRKFVDECQRSYLINKNNKLGTNMFFFDQYIPGEMEPEDLLAFNRNIFITNRTLKNVFFEERDEVMNRVKFFMERKDWYDEKGIPYTLGLLLCGVPGCGKTSCIKAIANMTNRHIVNLNMGEIKTKSALKKLFYEENLQVMEKGTVSGSKIQSYIIPIDKRIYVMEDVDCLMGDILKKRKEEEKEDTIQQVIDRVININEQPVVRGGLTNNEPQPYDSSSSSFIQNLSPINEQPEPEGGWQNEVNKEREEKKKKSRLDLSTVLNVLDGTLETPGRILIATSNYPETLDQAFIRPGRIDMVVEFKKANRKVIQDMYQSFYDESPDLKLLHQIEDYRWTPAEVSQILFKNFNEPIQSLTDLRDINPKEYFKFSYLETDDKEDILFD